MVVKSFRGKLVTDDIDTIVLHTNTGSTGYRITKFMLMPVDPASDNMEMTVKVYKISQTSASKTIDFNDNTLLAAGYVENHAGEDNGVRSTIFFDNEIFNQDVYVTAKEGDANSTGVNYYIEMEQIKLDLNENTVATLKDIRNIKSQ
jgi:hypothetical protein|tara:strand:- start:38 stop:478 length:441 start_codon:yes stop_codon:yes gene_type:complete